MALVVRFITAQSGGGQGSWQGGRIKMRGRGDGIVTQAAFVDHLAAYCSLKKARPDMRYVPVLFPFVKTADLVGLARLLVVYFVGVKAAKPKFWESDETLASSLFGKTNGVVVLFNILHDLICVAGGTSKLTIEFVSKKWELVGDEVVANPPRGGSKGYQKEVASKVLLQMFGSNAETTVSSSVAAICDQLRAEGGLI
ncbi:MAG: hypothetical protein QE570_09555 [Verrucomicrobiota bacterium]|nr:hypothetical protein [Verrucomicrobiota bacterium]